jgi:hypothetical protein
VKILIIKSEVNKIALNDQSLSMMPLIKEYAYYLLYWGKDIEIDLRRFAFIEREIKIIKFRGDPSKMHGVLEVRGIVNKDGTMSYGEYT